MAEFLFKPGTPGKDCTEKAGGWGLNLVSMIIFGRVILMSLLILMRHVLLGIMAMQRLIILQ